MSTEEFVVVTTTYPTTHGCRRGQNHLSELHALHQTDIQISNETYSSYELAVQAAREERDRSGWFDCVEDDGGDPPYSSAEQQNYDNDEEVLIEVLTESQAQEKEQEHFEKRMAAGAKCKFKDTVAYKMRKLQALNAKRVHYCTPRADWGIPAELEISDATDIPSLSNLEKVKTLMYKPASKIEYSSDCALFSALSKCTKLQELHLHMENHKGKLSEEFVEGLLEAQPELKETLVVLSIANVRLSPKAVSALTGFENLEHLDIMDTFDYHEVFRDDGPPYSDACSDLVSEIESLKRLDLGYPDDLKSMLVDELVGSGKFRAIRRNLKDRGGKGVTTTRAREPADWMSDEAQQAAKQSVLLEIANQQEDPLIAALARAELAQS